MAAVKDFRPETKFVLEHWDDVQLLVEALDAASTDVSGLLEAVQKSLPERSWFDEESWDVEADGKKGFYTWKKDGWGTGDEVFYLGVFEVSPEAIMSEDPTAWVYVLAPTKLRTDGVRERIRKAAEKGGLQGKSTSKYPFYRTFSFDGVRTEPAKIRDLILNELDGIAKILIPVIDAIASGK